MASSPPVALVVEDERNLADLYARWIGDEYAVRTAYDGDEALSAMDDDVAVVLLDRRMPGLSGDAFLERIREADYDCRVAIVSAVDPDFDVLEMGFDDYVTKPVDREELLDVVGRLLQVQSTPPDVREYYALVEKRVNIEAEKTDPELEASRAYADLLAEIDAFETRVVSLAEAAFESGSGGPSPALAETYRAAIEEWEERKAAADGSDPLAEVADEMIERYRRKLDAAGSELDEPRRDFLEVVADGFMAEGFWLDERILGALNAVLFDKYDETLVVERHALREGKSLEGVALYETSERVRELARQRLASGAD